MSTESTTDTAETGTPTGASPFLIFTGVSSLTTCESGNVSWAYAGPSSSLSLTITNIGVAQADPPGSSASQPPQTQTFSLPVTFSNDLSLRAIPTFLADEQGLPDTVVTLLTEDLDPSVRAFTWNPINVPEGWYTLYATMDEYPLFQAEVYNDFFVRRGSDVSCLSTSSTSSSFSHSATSTSGSSSQSHSPTTPVGAASASSVNKGAIAGGVVGGLAVVAAVIAAVLFFICAPARRRRAAAAAAASDGSGKERGIMGKWGALGSFDSTNSSGAIRKKKAKFYNKSPVIPASGSPSDRRRHDSMGPMMSMGSTAEDYNPYAEKESSNGHGFVPNRYEPSPRPGQLRHSSSSGVSEVYAMQPSRPKSAMLESTPESPRRATYDTSPVAEAETKRSATKKTPRKPVPSYVPETNFDFSSSTDTTPSTQHHAPSGMGDPPAQSTQNLTGSMEDIHTLIQKRSFGDGRPVHVLMPDMPAGHAQ